MLIDDYMQAFEKTDLKMDFVNINIASWIEFVCCVIIFLKLKVKWNKLLTVEKGYIGREPGVTWG